nr:hypothetical protein [Salinisphaera orenii]
MSTGEDRNLCAFDSVPNQKRESAEDRTPNFAVSLRVKKRSISKPIQSRTEFSVELGSQTRLLLFVPSLRFGDIAFCSATDINAIAQGS